jgi:hypothetical protein
MPQIILGQQKMPETKNPPSVNQTTMTTSFGTFAKPYLASSPWNRKSVNPVLGTETIPISSYDPYIGQGEWSTALFEALPSQNFMIVNKIIGSSGIFCTDGYYDINGIWHSDKYTYQLSIKIPHWPPTTSGAIGTDGHADICDASLNIIHSFFQLTKDTAGLWHCSQYSNTPLNGQGWANQSTPTQGSRAIGCPASAGLIRQSEINDGALLFNHALVMSLTYNALSQTAVTPLNTTGLFTAMDTNHSGNTGNIPYGSLIMLPSNYTNASPNADLQKVIKTLKTYGAYIADRNTGTPFVIYVENGSVPYNLMSQPYIPLHLQEIRAALRVVHSTSGWIDGDGNVI